MYKNLKEMELKILGELWVHNKTYHNVATLVDTISTPFPGTEAERKAREFLVIKFTEYGLDDIRVDPFRYLG